VKKIACSLTLLAALPTLLSAQVKVSATLGPIVILARLGGPRTTVRATPVSSSGHGTRTVTRATKASAARVLATARQYVGIRYRYGGTSPALGFDCSGFVQYVFGRNHIELPRTAHEQAAAGRPVSLMVDSLLPGDLMLFSSRGRRVDHVGIYLGDNRMVHSTAGAGKVVYEDLSTARGRWYLARHVASRRVL
jgi:cell wall-associated NlpC family hydrolase